MQIYFDITMIKIVNIWQSVLTYIVWGHEIEQFGYFNTDTKLHVFGNLKYAAPRSIIRQLNNKHCSHSIIMFNIGTDSEPSSSKSYHWVAEGHFFFWTKQHHTRHRAFYNHPFIHLICLQFCHHQMLGPMQMDATSLLIIQGVPSNPSFIPD